MNQAPTVTVGERTFELKAPASLALSYDIVFFYAKNPNRAAAAALAACWSGPGRPSVRPAAHGYDVGAWGGAALDEFLARGETFADVVAAGNVAVVHLSAGLASSEDVADAEDFSGPSGEASTG